MLAWPWNTVSKQNFLIDLMELLLKAMEETILDFASTGFTDNNNNMDLNSLPYLEVDDELFDDNDVLVGMEEI
jgi:hypothetical protein